MTVYTGRNQMLRILVLSLALGIDLTYLFHYHGSSR